MNTPKKRTPRQRRAIEALVKYGLPPESLKVAKIMIEVGEQ